MRRIFRALKNRYKSCASFVRKFVAWKTADYYYISFPKSGRTWVRMFLAQYFTLAFGVPFDEVFYNVRRPHQLVPKIVFSHSGFKGQIIGKHLLRQGGRGYSFTEEMGEVNTQELSGKNIIFMIRDPRDVVVSHFFALTRRTKRKDLEGATISDFIRDKRFGIANIIAYNNFWYSKRNLFSSFDILRYEECRKDPITHFATLLTYLGIDPIDENALTGAVEYSSFDNMRKIEQKGAIKDLRMTPGDAKDKESYKTRKGKAGGYVEYLKGEDLVYVNEQMEKLHPDLRYLPIT